MYTTYMLTVASMKMFVRNKQALFFSLFMPLMVLTIFGNIDFNKQTQMHIGLVTHQPSMATAMFINQIKAVPALGIDEGAMEVEMAALKAGNRTAVLEVPDELFSVGGPVTPRELTVHVNGGRPMDAQIAMSVVQQFADKATLAVSNLKPVFTIKREDDGTQKARYIEFLLPGVIAMSVMQMSVFSVAFVFARYKEKGILKRLTATPMRPSQFVTANIITRLCMAVLQAAVFVACGMAFFQVQVAGALWLLGMCVVLGALMFLGLGFTISGLARNLEAVPVLSNVLVFPMLFMGNVFFPVSTMPPWLRAIAEYLPLTFFAGAMRSVMTDGAGISAIERNVVGMGAWAVVLITLATVTFRFQDKEAV